MTRPEGIKLEYCPNCKLRSLFWNQTKQIWECLNPECRRIYTSSEFSEYWHNQQSSHSTPKRKTRQIYFDAPLWLVNILESKRIWNLLICFAVSWWCWMGIQYSSNSLGQAIALAFPILLLYIIKLLLRKYLNNYKTLAMQHNISPLFYSIRKSPLLRLGIILLTIALLATTIWSIYSFISNLIQNASLIYLLNMAVLIAAQIWLLNWLCKTLRHSRYISRKPKFAVVFWSAFAGIIFCAFIGIHPLSDTKNNAIASITDWWRQTTTVANPPAETKIPPPITTPRPITIPKPITPQAPTISEPKLQTPTWNQLLEFLKRDNTDAHSYIYPTFVCENFAEMLQSNAHKAGWRCAIVCIRVSGYPDFYHYGIPSDTGHACNAFNTTDRGLVYIDDTRAAGGGPANQDNIVDIKVGQEYIPKALFPTYGWMGSSLPMGVVVSVSDPQW